MAYRLKSDAYEAVQFSGDQTQAEALVAAMFTNVSPEYYTPDGSTEPAWSGNLQVMFGAVRQVATPGDYIMTGTDGTRFVITATEFAENYEEIPA